ncbi:hypothetical protein B0H67DRAFT_554442 [Lasiosphaeris hirsuta]|uniref:Duf1665 domain containing protein n=1 Tax=Lasiosphaeris hirsuta TaxID=260670 RepID=A0AA40DTT4_9PEZI|nr:hypothetical protein B0H67DRAFT_554442 [Lasiosphaeris hirsuta]
MASSSTKQFPGFGLPIEDEGKHRFPLAIDHSWVTLGVTLREQRMMDFMTRITDKSDWHVKVFDEEILSRWRAEADAHSAEVEGDVYLSQEMFDFCIAELRDKSTHFRATGRITILDAELAIIKSNVAISPALQSSLQTYVRTLEDVPDAQKDWHPGSDKTVLDLVHPSLFPVVWGLTRALDDGLVPLADCIKATGKGSIVPPRAEPPAPERRWLAQSPKSWGSFQWLPAQVALDADGGAKITSYVNNLHPGEHGALYGVLEGIVAATVPLWEESLNGFGDRRRVDVAGSGSDDYIYPPGLKYRVPGREGPKALVDPVSGDWRSVKSDDGKEDGGRAKDDGSVEDEDVEMTQVEDKDEDDESESGDDDAEADDASSDEHKEEEDEDEDEKEEEGDDDGDFAGDGGNEEGNGNAGDDDDEDESDDEWRYEDDFYEWKLQHRILQHREPRAYVPQEKLFARQKGKKPPINLHEDFPEGLQVIFKLANIHLTPEKPSYSGGTWHVEGTLNEMIVSSAIYYFDQDNITDSHLAFRQSMDTEEILMIPEQNEYASLEAYLGVEQEGPAVQALGQVLTSEGRLLVFPNCVQHQVQPFTLKDTTKPGYRKILAMFLVNPHRPILSSAHVPPQRRDWWAEEVRKDGGLAVLPAEIFNLTVGMVDDFPISWEQALEIRERLMEERGGFNQQLSDYFMQERFSFCEH